MRTLRSLLATLGVLLVAGRAGADVTVSGNLLIQTGASPETWTGPTLVQTGATPRTVSGNLTITTEANGSACASAVECTSGACANGYCCDTACNDGCGSCAVVGYLGTCRPLAAGSQCRASTDLCDVTEYCTGSTTSCPANGYAANGVLCRASAGPCDAEDRCSGTGPACPNQVMLAGVVCNSSGATCGGATSTCGGSASSGFGVVCP